MGWLGKIASGVGLLVVCLLVFDIPSAYVFSRGWSPWLALAVGLATFPLLPLVWHALGERTRKQKAAAAKGPTKPAMTRGWERLLMRGGAVGGVVIATLIAVDREGTWNAFRHHALWFVPERSEPLVADSQLLRVVPPTANAVLWVRANDEARGALEPTLGASTDFLNASELVIASAGNELIFAERGDFEIIKTFSELFDKLPMARPPMLEDRPGPLPGGGRYWASPGWSAFMSTGRPASLYALIPRAPDDAFIVGAALPGAGPTNDLFEQSGATAVVFYVHVQRTDLVFVAEVDFADAAQRDKAEADVKRALPALTGHTCAGVADLAADVTTRGTTLRVQAQMPVAQLRAAIRCADSH